MIISCVILYIIVSLDFRRHLALEVDTAGCPFVLVLCRFNQAAVGCWEGRGMGMGGGGEGGVALKAYPRVYDRLYAELNFPCPARQLPSPIHTPLLLDACFANISHRLQTSLFASKHR